MAPFLALSRLIDGLNALLGRAVMWLILLSILVSAANATTRKLLSISSNAWLELQWYLFGAAFMIAAADTLRRNEHIRIDIVSSRLPRAVRAWIELFGIVFMLGAFVVVMIRELVPFAIRSIESGEVSNNYGGLILWPAKTVIMVGFSLLALQAVSELIKRIAIMTGRIAEPDKAEPDTGHATPEARP